MKYEVKIGFMNGSNSFEVGDIIMEAQIPKKSKKWMLEQGIIEKYDENAGKKRARNDKGHFIADDPNTPENEAYEEEE
jgi:hypothetical protein|tara:strand:- start:4446 stop:4679 length:234 start_codon:yes stop_codon:yes gene_type:complete